MVFLSLKNTYVECNAFLYLNCLTSKKYVVANKEGAKNKIAKGFGFWKEFFSLDQTNLNYCENYLI